jgi:hypothetical protein
VFAVVSGKLAVVNFYRADRARHDGCQKQLVRKLPKIGSERFLGVSKLTGVKARLRCSWLHFPSLHAPVGSKE